MTLVSDETVLVSHPRFMHQAERERLPRCRGFSPPRATHVPSAMLHTWMRRSWSAVPERSLMSLHAWGGGRSWIPVGFCPKRRPHESPVRHLGQCADHRTDAQVESSPGTRSKTGFAKTNIIISTNLTEDAINSKRVGWSKAIPIRCP